MGSRRVLSALIGAAAAAALVTCGTSEADQAPPATTVAATSTTTAPATTAAPTTTAVTTTSAPPTTTAPTPTVEYHRNEAVYFTSPSGGFQCGIIELPTRTEAGCQGPTTPIPPRPESCVVDWGSGIRVTGAGRGEFLCAGGLVYTSGGATADRVLPVGQTVSSFGFTCKSGADGVTCTKDETGHGFRIASGSNDLF
ncbi:hypothetical protein FK531_11170 [Rhodococcus spelaei]|uniref:Lipoprotein n=1 Tax=Rhodococcus spelaei TaxID=2546320 RepID=A0A541BAC6_9NOCA|nr:DUF6636 domain-containing protein [Rhodococcus spelaei]TQF69292.1 hypothetical protein FK531_11170 [Rhodococcus spelaei]